ncbi:MAG: lysophospholipid acyltransferase family protein [Bacteroidota bacterium]
MKRAVLRLYSIVFYVIFVVVFLLILPFHFIFLQFKAQWAHDVSHRLNMLWGWLILYPIGIWLYPKNREKIDRKGIFIFAPNHSSYLDIPICNVSILHSFRFVGKAELSDVPLFGFMFKRLHIPVKRESVKDAYRSLDLSRKKLESGRSVLFFPEGTIPDKRKVTLLRFKDGAFKLAIETGTPIVPMTIVNADRALLDDQTWILRPARVKVIFHDPIPTADLDISEAGALKQRVYQLIYNTLKEHGAVREPEAQP